MKILTRLSVLSVLLFTLAGCEDPQEDPYRINRFFGFWILAAVVAVSALFIAGSFYLTRKGQ